MLLVRRGELEKNSSIVAKNKNKRLTWQIKCFFLMNFHAF